MGVKREGATPKIAQGAYPVVYRHVEVLPAGYNLLNAPTRGYTIPRGALLSIVPGTLTANLCKVAHVIGGGTTSAVRVAKGHPFAAGDVVIISGKKQGVAIASIDSGPEFDTFNFGTPIVGGDQEGVMVEADGATASAKPKHLPNSFVEREIVVDGSVVSVSAAARGMLLHGNVETAPEYLNGIFLVGNPNILIVKQ